MAWRIEDSVAHGEIDNTVEGRTTGRIWLAGHDEPLILSLDGDCWRDLAGSKLQFENPHPQVLPVELDIDQGGIVGDMTASRKCKVPTVDEEEFHALCQSKQEIPFQWRNVLYLEWFSDINGRVVIETADYVLSVSPHEWVMDEDAEDAQKLANLNAMRDFMAQIIRRRDPDETPPDVAGELDEFAWEERLKESDRLTDAYQEVLEKYMEEPDSERKEAFVMGWDGLLDALADREEREEIGEGKKSFSGFSPSFEDGADDLTSGEEHEEADDDIDDEDHPLQAKAQELAMRAMDVVPRDAGPGTPAYQLVGNLLQVSGKLAGVLHGHGSGYEPETGFILAVLKRCLNWLNEAVGACQQLVDREPDVDQRAALEHIRQSVFEVRDDIVALRRELK